MSARSGDRLRRGAVAAVSLAACGPLWAAEGDDIHAFTRPDSSIDVGIGVVSDDNTRFGQYTGLTKDGAYPLIDLELRRRDDASGTWMNIFGRNLGLESKELRFEHERQGRWGYFLDYGETPRYSPYTALTRLANPDGASQVVNGVATPYELELKTLRKAFSAGFGGNLTRNYDYGVRFSNEEKEGRRLFGRTGAGSFQEFIVDPVDYTTQTWEARGGYTDERLQLNASYFGTNFTNHKPRLDVSGTASVYTPIGLPPDNQSHQLGIAGGYAHSPTTRSTFKLAYTYQTQTAGFIDTSTTGRTDLGGKVQTLFAQAGLSTRPSKDLTILGNVRYEDRDDKTPIVDYFNITTTSTSTGENEPRSIRTLAAKVEGIYRLAMGLNAVGGVEFDQKTRNTSAIRIVSFRETTEETTLRAELRRIMSETVNGSIAYIFSTRDGSDWQTNVRTDGTVGSNLLHPLNLADRDRNMLRAKLGWAATESMDLQFVADYAQDDYGGRTLGLTDGRYSHFAVDGTFRLTDVWEATGFVSRDDWRTTQVACEAASSAGVCPNTAADPRWEATLRNTGFAIGAGLRGKPRTGLEVGAELQYAEDEAQHQQAPLVAGVAPLPDTNVKHTTFKLYAKQEVAKNLSVRAKYVFDRFKSDDWTWETWTYDEGTRILTNPDQKVHFIALQLQYRM